MLDNIKKPPEVIEDEMQKAIRRLEETVVAQGSECERRHNILCGIKEIIAEYFE